MNDITKISTGTVLLVVLLMATMTMGCVTNQPISREQAGEEMVVAVNRTARSEDRLGTSILVHSDRKNLHILARGDQDGADAFHVASVGKLFTTVLIGKLIDAGELAFDQPVGPLLIPGTLDGLFVFDGTDYQDRVTIRQLLSHTSGVADYYGDVGSAGRSVAQIMVEEPDRRWTPVELVEFTRNEQTAVGRPGETFHYSDTGFVLLGMVIEAVTGEPFHTVLEREILVPLEMERTWMPFRSKPATGDEEIRGVWIDGVEVSRFPSITADWAGGGIASTEEDLLTFSRALWTGDLISPETRSELLQFEEKFMRAIYYGLGVMEYRLDEIFFLLLGYPALRGHMGILGTLVFYWPEEDTHFVVSVGSDAGTSQAVQLMIRAVGTMRKME